MQIVEIMNLRTYDSNENIIIEGEQGDAMYLIKNGSVSVTKNGSNNDEIFIALLGKGSFFGELSLFDNLPRSANVKSLDDSEIFKLSRMNFQSLLKENMHLATQFYKNCMYEIFSRHRNTLSNYTFSQNVLKEKTDTLQEISKDLDIAKKLQDYFINSGSLDENNENSFFGNVKHTYVYDPCIAIGGDFLNVIPIDENKTAVIIADFEGHGISAALGTGVLKSALAILFKEYISDPTELMAQLNNHFIEVIQELYATCYLIVYDGEKNMMTFIKAGHHHPLFWKKNNEEFLYVDCPGTALGLISDAHFGMVQHPVEKGDKILLFTDGIIEQRNNSNEMYSLKRLKNLFKDRIVSQSASIVQDLHEDMKVYAEDEEIEDDVTLFLLEF